MFPVYYLPTNALCCFYTNPSIASQGQIKDFWIWMWRLFTDTSQFNMQSLDVGKGGSRLFRPASLLCSIRPWQPGELLSVERTQRERETDWILWAGWPGGMRGAAPWCLLCPGLKRWISGACAAAAACRWSDRRTRRAAASSGLSTRSRGCGRTAWPTCTPSGSRTASGTFTASWCRTLTPMDPYTGTEGDNGT